MNSPLEQFGHDHATMLREVSAAAGFSDPVAFDADDCETALLRSAIRGAFHPVAGVLIRDWDRDWKKQWPGMIAGFRLHRLDGIPFAQANFGRSTGLENRGLNVFIVDRRNYARLYRLARKLKRKPEVEVERPVMDRECEEALQRNSIAFLEPKNFGRIKRYGGRAKRGLLLTGPPGNGKTSACRWLKQEAEKSGWTAKCVTPDDYQEARRDSCPAEAVRALFRAAGRGIVFFDDMDIALRDRSTVKETDDQAVFLSAMDGLETAEGVVFVFTTNCPIELIDPAFRRPGRIDLTIHFPKPDGELRSRLVERWHSDITGGIGLDRIVVETDGLSFAEIEELKNLLVQRFLEAGDWNWDWAKDQFADNRSGLVNKKTTRAIGFVPPARPTSIAANAV